MEPKPRLLEQSDRLLGSIFTLSIVCSSYDKLGYITVTSQIFLGQLTFLTQATVGNPGYPAYHSGTKAVGGSIPLHTSMRQE